MSRYAALAKAHAKAERMIRKPLAAAEIPATVRKVEAVAAPAKKIQPAVRKVAPFVRKTAPLVAEARREQFKRHAIDGRNRGRVVAVDFVRRAECSGRPAAHRVASSSSSRGSPGDQSGSSEGDGEPPGARLLFLVDEHWGRVNLPLLRTLRSVAT